MPEGAILKNLQQGRCEEELPKRASKLLKEYPNLGKDIEQFVHENCVGADAWRRTEVATFDGNIKSGKRVTSSRIKEHLDKKYGMKFSYGAVVQLSVSSNKQRASLKHYWGLDKTRKMAGTSQSSVGIVSAINVIPSDTGMTSLDSGLIQHRHTNNTTAT